MFQSVTYTGFEKHPELRAWVEGVVMPLMAEVFRKEARPFRVHWHDPDLGVATAATFEGLVRRDVLPDLGDGRLVGQIDGEDAEDDFAAHRPGLLLVLECQPLPTGWALIPLPLAGVGPSASRLQWLLGNVYFAMLYASIRKRIEGFGDREPVEV